LIHDALVSFRLSNRLETLINPAENAEAPDQWGALRGVILGPGTYGKAPPG
jgi:hypothetical protein